MCIGNRIALSAIWIIYARVSFSMCIKIERARRTSDDNIRMLHNLIKEMNDTFWEYKQWIVH